MLSNARTRGLYDLSREAPHSTLRAAAAQGLHDSNSSDEVELDLPPALASLLGLHRRHGNASPAHALDQLRDQLRSDVGAALRRAYLGPDLSGLPLHLLPEAFEAEERSVGDTPELLHLVSERWVPLGLTGIGLVEFVETSAVPIIGGSKELFNQMLKMLLMCALHHTTALILYVCQRYRGVNCGG